MDSNNELLQYIYEDAEMGAFTLNQLLKDLNDKDNHIKSSLEEILKDYEKYQKIAEERLTKNDVKPKSSGLVAKMGSTMGIKKEVIHDNSDSSIADMVIQGLTMGTTDIEKRIKQFDDKTDKENQKLAEEVLEFETNAIDKLKAYL